MFAASIAPTEEVLLLAGAMTPVHAIGLVCLELALMHLFIYAVDFKGGATGQAFGRVLLPYTVVGFVIASGVSAYLLWSFGRFDGTGLGAAVTETIVLALPASIRRSSTPHPVTEGTVHERGRAAGTGVGR